jgi:hypothetical protein
MFCELGVSSGHFRYITLPKSACILLKINPHTFWVYFMFLLLVCLKFPKLDTCFKLAVDFVCDGFNVHY